MLALVDADIICYRIGFSCEDETEEETLSKVEKYIEAIMYYAEADDFKLFLTDSKGNYRNAIYSEYKKNRVQDKPKHFKAIREYIAAYQSAVIAYGQEADDAMGIEQCLLGDESIICSIDKDMLMIPGWHFNFVNGSRTYITPEDGLRKFYTQLLTGDRVDNIPGIKGIGPKKAAIILDGVLGVDGYNEAVYSAYALKNPDMEQVELEQLIDRNGKLLWIRRKEGEMWQYERTTVVS